MKKIISQSYINVSRTITNNRQSMVEKEEYLHLYEDRITTTIDVFFLDEVHDISFKQFSAMNGFLYLHTNKGVYPYMVPSMPTSFIEEFKKLKQFS